MCTCINMYTYNMNIFALENLLGNSQVVSKRPEDHALP